jgi:hypothetical protein
MRFSSRFVALTGTALFIASPAQAGYNLDVAYDKTNFFNSFDFFTDTDPTKGFVEYVNGQTAQQEGLAVYAKGGVFMGVDTKTMNPPRGRKSVRVTSKKAFNRGLFVADIAHMPGSICGVWPAFWMFGPNWPAGGEIDILEGVNTQTKNSVTLHTSPGCSISNQGSLASTKLASADCGAAGSSSGCGQAVDDTQTYGNGFNAAGGGVYATEWTSDHIAVWFFPRSRIPQDIQSQNPNPATWGQPTARFVGGSSCKIDSFFNDHQIIFDTTFCGDWAGLPQVWDSNPQCAALAPTCNQYVANNPAAFVEAYWVINSVKVYQQGAGTPPATSPKSNGHWGHHHTRSSSLLSQPTFEPQPLPTQPTTRPVQVQPPESTKTSPEAQPTQPTPPVHVQHTESTKTAPQAQPSQSQSSKEVKVKVQPDGQSGSKSQPPPAKVYADQSWNGQVWNGEGWHVKRGSNVVARRFFA